MQNKLLTVRGAVLAALTAILALCITFGIIALPKGKNAADAQISVWDGNLTNAGWADTETNKAQAPATYILSEDGKEIEIGSAEALAYFAHQIFVDTAHTLDGVKVTLTADIDLGGDKNIWIPIGTTKRSSAPDIRFSGTFDGNGHTVYNLTSTGFYRGISYDTDNGYYINGGNGIKVPFAHDKGEYAYGLFGVTANMTVTNLTLTGVKFDLTDKSVNDTVFLADSVGAIIGHNAGSLNVKNCVSGLMTEENTSDSVISVRTAGNPAIGGLVGRAYGLKQADSATATQFENIKIENGKNNVSFSYEVSDTGASQCGKVSGIIGFATNFKNCEIIDCDNYGDVNGGQFAGGIVSFFSDGSVNSTVKEEEWNFTIDGCNNYGTIAASNLDSDIYSKGPKTYAGGIMASLGASTENCASIINGDENYGKLPAVNLLVTNCRNYGEVRVYNTESINGDSGQPGSGWNAAGGIIGYLFPSETGVNAITDCYNYGDVYGDIKENSETYTPIAGGFIGWLYYYWGETDKKPADREIDLTLTGGSCGKVYGDVSCSNVNSIIGYNSYPGKPVTINLIDAGGITDNAFDESEGLLIARAERVAATYELQFNDDKTVITGITVSGDGEFELNIPENITAIDFAAFAGVKNLTKVNFAENGALSVIDDWAFAGTGITELNIPATVNSIGAAAFGDCAKLVCVTFGGANVKTIGKSAFANCPEINYVELPSNAAQIEYGDYVFDKQSDGSVYLIAEDSESFEELSSVFTGVNVTYPITINYYRGDELLGSEIRLYNTDYKVRFVKDKWEMTEINELGPSGLTGIHWYYYSQLVGVDDVTQLLSEQSRLDNIDLYAFDGAAKHFIPRNGIVYDENTSYQIYELNDLLSNSSDKIETGMVVSIERFVTPDNKQGVVSGEIHDAGTYYVSITAGSDSYEIEITIGQKTVDLGDYAQLSWKIQGAEVNADMRDMSPLYIYYKNGLEYPSDVLLSDEQISMLGLGNTYITREVLYSVVRYAGAPVTVCMETNPAFSIVSTGGTATASAVGMYTATATLSVNANYRLVDSSVSALRGLNIEFNNDGTVDVSKQWYIVNMTNWLVSSSGADYSVRDFIYGNTPGVSLPQLKYNNYDQTADLTFYMELQLNGARVGSLFTPNEFGDYINNTMPAGEYKLIVTVGSVTSKEWDEETDPGHTQPPTVPVYHAGFTETHSFTVDRKGLQSLAHFCEALNGNQFTYKWDGQSHFFEQSEEVNAAYSFFLDGFFNPVKRGIWANYPEYYGTPEISYNLERMQSAEYHSSELVYTGDADTYKVYYKISAPNYYDSLERLSTGDSRTNYYFYVVNVKEIAIPVLTGKTYTGDKLTADVNLPSDDEGNPLYYTVLTNNGGTNAGTYGVVLGLIDPVHYMWEGQDVDGKTPTVTVDFNINKSADNYFTTTLGITTWVVEQYEQLEEFPVSVDACFGTVVLTLSYSDDIENVIYTGVNGTDAFIKALSELKSGTYILTATVADSDDFNGISDVITFRVFEKDGLPWWAVLLIVVGALGIVAIIFFILHQKGVLQMLTGKVVIAMRTKATVDATIAAVRANKVAADAKKTVAKAEARDRLQALREAQAQAKNMTAEEQAAAFEEKAQAAAKSAEKMQKRANSMQKKADKIKKQAENRTAEAQPEQTVTSDEQPEDKN